MTAVLTLTPPVRPTAPPPVRTVADLLRDLGDIPAHRVRMTPTPGTATEADCLAAGKCVELVHGTLVEMAVGYPQGDIAMLLGHFLMSFVLPRRLGPVVQPDARFRMTAGNLQEPDLSFTRRHRLPNPLPQVAGWCPDLCVEVLSPDNTRQEMLDKRTEYFAAGCQLVWEVHVEARCIDVYTDATTFTRLTVADTLGGGAVLPGFALPLGDLFNAYDANSRPDPS